VQESQFYSTFQIRENDERRVTGPDMVCVMICKFYTGFAECGEVSNAIGSLQTICSRNCARLGSRIE
jgi:hypothetical protein